MKIQTGLFFKSFLEVRSVVVSPVDEQCPPFRRRTTDQCQKKTLILFPTVVLVGFLIVG